MKPKLFLYLLVPALLIECYSEVVHWQEAKFFLKPLLLVLIACYYFFSMKEGWATLNKIMMLSFVFSWFGDFFLILTPENVADLQIMGIPKSKYFFLGGVGSFLLAQLSFITAFRKSVNDSNSKLNKLWMLPFVVYWLVMMYLVAPAVYHNPEKSAATLPVIIYSATLISMGMFALNRFGRTNRASFLFTLTGACLFIISDSLIAINFLVLPEPMSIAGFLIMVTFIPAELLIAEGMLKHQTST